MDKGTYTFLASMLNESQKPQLSNLLELNHTEWKELLFTFMDYPSGYNLYLNHSTSVMLSRVYAFAKHVEAANLNTSERKTIYTTKVEGLHSVYQEYRQQDISLPDAVYYLLELNKTTQA